MKIVWTKKKGCALILMVPAWFLCMFYINFRSFLHYESMNGNLPVIVGLTLLGGRPTAGSNERALTATPLHYAAEYGHINVVKYYLMIGANPNVLSRGGRYTPVAMAAEHGHEDLVKLLVKKGAKLYAGDPEWHRVPLERAIIKKDSSMVSLLLDLMREESPGWYPAGRELWFAMRCRDRAIISLMLPEALVKYDEAFGELVPPVEGSLDDMIDLLMIELHDRGDLVREATKRELPGTAAFICQNLCSLGKRNEEHLYPLAVYWCIYDEDEATLRLLAKSGYPLETSDPKRGTPLESAVKLEREGMALIIREYLDKDAQ